MEYLNKVLGIKIKYSNKKFEHLPNFIITRYHLRRAWLDKEQVIFIYPKTNLESLEILKKHILRIQKEEKLPIVLILKELTYRQKEYLIRDRIPFIVENKQIYLPFLAVYLAEKCNAEYKEKKILPSAQILLLHFIYNGAKELSTNQASKNLGLTPTSISRASKQLEKMGFLRSKKVGVQKILFSETSAKDIFQNAESRLLNPIKRTIYIPKESVENDLLKSGYSALSDYSILNPSKLNFFATNKISKWNEIAENDLQDSQTQVALELWRYDPHKLSSDGTVDALSLALALKEDPDERVEAAIEEMLEKLWRKIDNYRN